MMKLLLWPLSPTGSAVLYRKLIASTEKLCEKYRPGNRPRYLSCMGNPMGDMRNPLSAAEISHIMVPLDYLAR